MIKDIIADFSANPENSFFLAKLLGADDSRALLEETASKKEAEAMLADAESQLKKSSKGYKRRGEQFATLYPSDVDYNDPNSKRDYIEYLSKHFVATLGMIRAYIAASTELEAGEGVEPEEAVVNEVEETEEDKALAEERKAVVELNGEIRKGLKTQYHVADVLRKNIQAAFGKLYALKLPRHDKKAENPDAERVAALAAASKAFENRIVANIGKHDFDLLVDFYGNMVNHPEQAIERYPILKHLDQERGVKALEALALYVEKNNKLPSGKHTYAIPGSADAVSDREGILQDIRKQTAEVAAGTLEFTKSHWLREALKASPAHDLVKGVLSSLNANPIDIQGSSKPLADVLRSLVKEPFGHNGLEIINTDLEGLEDKVVAALDSYLATLRLSIGAVKDDTSPSAKTETGEDIMDFGTPSYVRKPVGDIRVRSPFNNLPQDTETTPEARKSAEKSTVQNLVSSSLIKAFPTLDLTRVRTLKDIGDEWTKNKGPSPMEGIRDSLTQAFKTLSSVDTVAISNMADNFADESPNSPINVALDNVEVMDEQLNTLVDLANKVKKEMDVTQEFSNPFDAAIEANTDPEVEQDLKRRRRAYNSVFRGALSAVGDSFKDSINLKAGSSDFLTMDIDKALAPLAGLDVEGRAMKPSDIPEYIQNLDPHGRAIKDSTTKNELNLLHKRVRALAIEVSTALSELKNSYDETHKLMKGFLKSMPPVPAEGETLKSLYETALQEKSYRTLLLGESSTPTVKELGEGKLKQAAEKSVKAQLSGAVRALNKGLQTLKGLGESSIKDLKEDQVFKRLEDFHGAMVKLDGDHNFGSNLINYVISRTDKGALHKFIEDYYEFYSFAKVLSKTNESLDNMSGVISTVIGGAFGSTSKSAVSDTVKTAARLIGEGKLIQAATLIRKIAARAFSPVGETKAGVSTVSPENVAKTVETLKKNSVALHETLNYLGDATKSSYDSKESDVDLDSIKKALSELAKVSDISGPVKLSSNSARIISSLSEILDIGKGEDYLGDKEYGDEADIRYHLREQNVDSVHEAIAAVSQEVQSMFNAIQGLKNKVEGDVKELDSFSELSEEASKAVSEIVKELPSGRVSKEHQNALFSDSVKSFLLREAKKVGNRFLAPALKDFQDNISKYDTEKVGEDNTVSVLDDAKLIKKEYSKVADPVAFLKVAPPGESEKAKKSRLEELAKAEDRASKETEADRDDRLSKAEEAKDRLEGSFKVKMRELEGQLDLLAEFTSKLKDQSSEVLNRKLSLEGHLPALNNMVASLPNAKEALEAFKKNTHQAEKAEKEEARSYLDISDSPFTRAYKGAMGSAIRSTMNKAILKLLDQGKPTAAKFVEDIEKQEMPIKSMMDFYKKLSEKKSLSDQEVARKVALESLLSSWPDKSISWAFNKVKELEDADARSEGDVKDWSARDVLRNGITSYISGEADSLKDAVHAEAISSLSGPNKDAVFARVTKSLNGFPHFDLKSDVQTLEDSLKASSSDREKYKSLMKSDEQRKGFIDSASKAKDMIEGVHPAMEQTRAHRVAQHVLSNFKPQTGSSLKSATEKALAAEVVRPGESQLTEKQVKHAIKDMASAGTASDYIAVNGLLREENWENPELGRVDGLAKAKLFSDKYAKKEKPHYGTGAHERAKTVLRSDTIEQEPKPTNSITPAKAEEHLEKAQRRNNTEVQSSRPEGQAALKDYTRSLTDKLGKLREERATMPEGEGSDDYAKKLTSGIDDIIGKLNTYHGNRKSGIAGSDKELAEEALNHYKNEAQKAKDKALAFSKYRAAKAKSESDRTEHGAVSKERADALAEQYGFDDTTDFSELATKASSLHNKAIAINRGIFGRKDGVVLEGGDVQDLAIHDKYFSGGQGHGAGDLDMGSISTNLGGGNQKYVMEEAQQFLINWVNHLKESGATSFTDDGYIYKALDATAEKMLKKVKASYKGSRIEGFSIDGIKYPGILDELNQKRKKWVTLLENIKTSDKELSEAFHPLMEDLAKIVKENEEVANSTDEAINNYYESYENISSQQAKEDNMANAGFVQDDDGMVTPEGVDDVESLQGDLGAAIDVNGMDDATYTTTVEALGRKLKKLESSLEDGTFSGSLSDIFTANEMFILGPELASRVSSAPTNIDAKNAVRYVLNHGTDRFRDYKLESERLLDKLSFFEGSAQDVQDRLEKAPISFTDREYDLMGAKLSSFVDGVLDGTITGRDIRINGPEARKTIGEDFKETVSKKAEKLKTRNIEQSTRTVLGEQSLRDARLLYNHLVGLSEINKQHAENIAEINEAYANGDYDGDEGEYRKDLAAEDQRHSKALPTFANKKPRFSRPFQKALSQATKGEPINSGNIAYVMNSLEKAFTHQSGPVSSSELNSIKEVEGAVSELKDLLGSDPINNDPTSLAERNKKIADLRKSSSKALTELRKAGHPSLRSLTDIAKHRVQANQSGQDNLSNKRLEEWLETADGKEFAKTSDLNALVENKQLLTDLKRIEPLQGNTSLKFRGLVGRGIAANMVGLKEYTKAIKNKTYDDDVLEEFADALTIVDHILYPYLSGYFKPSELRTYNEAKSLLNIPFIKARVLGSKALTDNAGMGSGTFDSVKGLKDLRGDDRLKEEEVSGIDDTIKIAMEELTKKLDAIMSSGGTPEEVLKDKNLAEVHKIIDNFPEELSSDFIARFQKWESSTKLSYFTAKVEELLSRKNDMIEAEAFAGLDDLNRKLSRVKSEIERAKRNSENPDSLSALVTRIADSTKGDNLIVTREAQSKVDQSVRGYAKLLLGLEATPDESYSSSMKELLTTTEAALDSLKGLDDATAVSIPEDAAPSVAGLAGEGAPVSTVLNKLHTDVLNKLRTPKGRVELSESTTSSGTSKQKYRGPGSVKLDEDNRVIKRAGGSDDSFDSDKQNWALQNATQSYPGAPGSSESSAVAPGSKAKKFDDIVNRDKVIKSLKDSYDSIVQKQGKGRTIKETKVERFPHDTMLDSSRRALDAVRHFQTGNGLRKRSNGAEVDDLAAQVHAVNKHEEKHGPTKLSDSQKKLVSSVKARWSTLGKNLEQSLKGLESKIKLAEDNKSEDHVIAALRDSKDKVAKDLAKHAELSTKGAQYAGDSVHNLITELHSVSLDVEKRMEEYVELTGREGTSYGKDTVKASEALSQLHEALKRLGQGQAKLRNAQALAVKEIDSLDDLIDGWSKSLSHAKANGGNGLSAREEKMWTRMFLNQMMHWLMWVWGRNSDRFEKVFNARSTDFDQFSEMAQSKVGMFNNPRINRMMVQLTETIDQVGKKFHKNMPDAQKRQLRTLKESRSKLYMYKYSLSHMKDVMDNIRVWADKNDLTLDRTQEAETEKALDQALKNATSLAAETSRDLESFRSTFGAAEEVNNQTEDVSQSVAKMAHMSLGKLSVEAVSKILNRFKNGV